MRIPILILAVLLTAPAFAQNYGYEDPGDQTTTGDFETVPSFMPVEQQGGDWSHSFTPPPKTGTNAQPAPAARPTSSRESAPFSGKEIKPRHKGSDCNPNRSGYTYSGRKSSKCGKGEEDQQMQPPSMGGGQGGDEAEGEDKGTCPGSETPGSGANGGAGGTQGDDQGAGQCSGEGGLCGDTKRETEVGGKLVQFKDPGLQPGDGEMMPPQSTQDPSGLNSELGTVRSYSPGSLKGEVRRAIIGIARARSAFATTAVEGIFSQDQTALDSAYSDIMAAPSRKIRRAARLDKLRVKANIATVDKSLANLRAAAEAMAEAGDASAQTLASSVQEAQQTDGQMTSAYSQLRMQCSSAGQTHLSFSGFNQSFNACPPPVPPAPPTPNPCKQAIKTQAEGAKQAFVPDPAKQAADQAFQTANRARGTLRKAQAERTVTEEKIKAYQAAQKSAQAAITRFSQDFSALGRQVGSANAEARISALQGIASRASSTASRIDSIHSQEFSPAWKQAVQAMDDLVRIMDGQ